MDEKIAVIIGAGPAGLTAALESLRRIQVGHSLWRPVRKSEEFHAL